MFYNKNARKCDVSCNLIRNVLIDFLIQHYLQAKLEIINRLFVKIDGSVNASAKGSFLEEASHNLLEMASIVFPSHGILMLSGREPYVSEASISGSSLLIKPETSKLDILMVPIIPNFKFIDSYIVTNLNGIDSFIAVQITKCSMKSHAHSLEFFSSELLDEMIPSQWKKEDIQFFMLWISNDTPDVELQFPKMPLRTPMKVHQACIPIRYLVEAFHTAYRSNAFQKGEKPFQLTAIQEDSSLSNIPQGLAIKRKRQ
jgi:hypothetical protein